MGDKAALIGMGYTESFHCSHNLRTAAGKGGQELPSRVASMKKLGSLEEVSLLS
jgi:hypothetical protein